MKLRLAVADDEPDVRTLLIQVLEYLGHKVVCEAADGVDLVKKCLDQRIDVALVDLDMPQMDGLAAAEALFSKGIPVILISGHSDAEHVVVEHEPIAARLTKPASIENVRRAIDQAANARTSFVAKSEPQSAAEPAQDRSS